MAEFLAKLASSKQLERWLCCPDAICWLPDTAEVSEVSSLEIDAAGYELVLHQWQIRAQLQHVRAQPSGILQQTITPSAT